MTATRTTWWIALAAGLLLACASAQAMDLRDMPQWLRDSIDLVWIDWDRLAAGPEPGPAEVHLAIPEDLAAVAVGLRGAEEPVQAVEAAGVQAAPEGVHVSATGGEMLGPVEVRALGGVGLAEPESVHVGDRAEEMTRALAEIEGLDHKLLAQAGHIVSIIREQNMTPEEFVQWAQENAMGPKAMAAAYVIASRERPRWNQVTEIVSAALLEAAGADLEHLEEIPVCGKPGLAIYLGLLERGEDVKRVLSSMSPSELETLPGTPHYHVATQLCWNDKCLRTAIWAWKTEAARRGAMDRALVCFTIRAACKRLGDPKVVREELIPWAEEALALPGSESQWDRALPALLWAYDYVGERQKAIERGRYWLQEAKERDVSAKSLAHARHLLDRLTDTTDASPPGGG